MRTTRRVQKIGKKCQVISACKKWNDCKKLGARRRGHEIKARVKKSISNITFVVDAVFDEHCHVVVVQQIQQSDIVNKPRVFWDLVDVLSSSSSCIFFRFVDVFFVPFFPVHSYVRLSNLYFFCCCHQHYLALFCRSCWFPLIWFFVVVAVAAAVLYALVNCVWIVCVYDLERWALLGFRLQSLLCFLCLHWSQ